MCDYGIIERKIYCGRIFRPRRIDAEMAESRWSRKPVTNTVCALCLGGQADFVLQLQFGFLSASSFPYGKTC